MVNRLRNYDDYLNKCGKLKLQGILTCLNNPRKPQLLQVFLFENVIIFSEICFKRQFHDPDYFYKNQIKVSKFQKIVHSIFHIQNENCIIIFHDFYLDL